MSSKTATLKMIPIDPPIGVCDDMSASDLVQFLRTFLVAPMRLSLRALGCQACISGALGDQRWDVVAVAESDRTDECDQVHVQGKIKSSGTVAALTLCLHMIFDGTTLDCPSAAISRKPAPVLAFPGAVVL